MPGSPLRQLHVIGFTSDRRGLLLGSRSGSQNATFVLPLDDELLAQLDRMRPGPSGSGQVSADRRSSERRSPPSLLNPREIQARLRSGMTVKEVADESGTGVEWIERFAGPVMAERAAAVERAGRAVLKSARKGPSDRPLEAAVRKNLADQGIILNEKTFGEAWSAKLVVERDWQVSFRLRHAGRRLAADGVLNGATGEVVPSNRLAGELGFVERRRPADDDHASAASEAAGPAGTVPGDEPAAPARAAARGSRDHTSSRATRSKGASRASEAEEQRHDGSGDAPARAKSAKPARASGQGKSSGAQIQGSPAGAAGRGETRSGPPDPSGEVEAPVASDRLTLFGELPGWGGAAAGPGRAETA